MPSKIEAIKQMIDSAEASLKSAKKMLLELSGGDVNSDVVSSSGGPAQTSTDGASKVIEGVFNGEQMVAPDGELYPVPANYASKSKLVAGDQLKLSIMPDGRLLYKQIGPVPRKTIIGTLVSANGQYKVMADTKSYNVLLASVTYYKANVGDRVTIITPEAEDSDWAAIEAVLPADVKQMSVHEEEPEMEEEVEF